MEAGTPQLVKLEDLHVPGQLSGRKHILSILVENKPGVLARIAGLFSRRGFNIDTLAVGPTDDPSISRITLTLDGAVHPIDQVTKQLHKLVNVLKIRDMEPEETVAREMAMFKVSAAVENRAEIIQFAEIFRAKIVDVAAPHDDDRGDRLRRQDRGLRADGPPARAGRDGPHGRDRDRPRRRLSSCHAGLRERASSCARSSASAARRWSASPPRSRASIPARRSSPRGWPRDRWFCWEQPDREFALAGARRRPRGDLAGRRTASTTSPRSACGSAATRSLDEPRGLPAGAGPVWLGGFAFDPEGGALLDLVLARRRPRWSCRSSRSAAAASAAFLTVNAVVAPGEDAEARRRALAARLAGAARRARCRCSTRTRPRAPRSAAPARRASSKPRSTAATERIGAGEMSKVVLAREVIVERRRRPRPGGPLRRHARAVPGLLLLLLRHPGGGLHRRQPGAAGAPLGRRASRPSPWPARPGAAPTPPSTTTSASSCCAATRTAASSGSSPSGSSAPCARTRSGSRPRPEPEIVKVANIQHLATPVIAQLAEPRSAIELAGLLHPTPAVGGEPWPAAAAAIAELEGMDRGWYAGPVGWMDATEDGEFCVALRSALLRDREAHLFAGVGVVAGSDPAAELAETEVKLRGAAAAAR